MNIYEFCFDAPCLELSINSSDSNTNCKAFFERHLRENFVLCQTFELFDPKKRKIQVLLPAEKNLENQHIWKIELDIACSESIYPVVQRSFPHLTQYIKFDTILILWISQILPSIFFICYLSDWRMICKDF